MGNAGREPPSAGQADAEAVEPGGPAAADDLSIATAAADTGEPTGAAAAGEAGQGTVPTGCAGPAGSAAAGEAGQGTVPTGCAGPAGSAAPADVGPADTSAADAPMSAQEGESETTGVVGRVVGPARPVSANRGPPAGIPGTEPVQGHLRGSILPGARVTPVGPANAGAPHEATTPVFLIDASRIAMAWARRRSLGLTSACGISVALACCAAVWFSAGTSLGVVRGVIALWTGYLVLAGGQRIAERGAGPAAAHRRVGPAIWLAALGSALAETIVYLGLVIGATAEHSPGTWKLGVTVVGLVAVRNVMTVCSTPYGFSDPADSIMGKIGAAVVTMTFGGRVLVAGVVALIWDARTALLVLVAWAISSIAYGLAGRPADEVLAEGTEADGGGPVRASATLLRLRDDGALARAAGALVRGNLLPLPPAILGLAAVSALAVLGLHGLPGALTIGPAIVMLLAAPGSANPHAGRLDWLVPVLLVGAQVLYVVAVGLGQRVPGPVIFALVAALLVRYAELVCPRRPVLLVRLRRHRDGVREFGTDLGWEGRLLFVGLTAAIGVATIGYLALTVYLAALVGAKVVRSCLPLEKDVP